jgi:predicted permease
VALRSIFFRRRVEADLEEELQDHLKREIDQNLRAGLAPDEARYAALRAMGAIEKSKDESRDLRSGNLAGQFLGDLRYAGRTIRRSPVFSALAITIMALGIGANTAVFSVVNAVLLKPLPYPGADRIVTLSTSATAARELNPLVAIANFRDWRNQSSSFDAMATYRGGEAPVAPGDAAEYGRLAIVDGQFFRVFAIEPAIGRTFNLEETAAGSDQQAAALISHGYWQSRFGGDPKILERTIRVNGRPRLIVGVMPAGFQFPNGTDIWVPQTTRSTSRTSHNLFAVARLKAGVPLQAAQAELDAIATRLEQQFPDSNKGRGVAALRLQDTLVRSVRLTLYLLWGVVGVVLLIACANTATLLLGKATARTREIAVRTALGASRTRIIRQLVTESLVLSVVAGALGIGLAYWGSRALVALTPADVVRSTDAALDGRVLAFTLVVSITTSVLFGLVPALHASRVDLADVIKQGGARSVTGGRGIRIRGVLVAGEVALAVVLMTGAGLLIKSLVALHHVELGFQPQNALVMKATGNARFFTELLPRISALPGVLAAGATSIPPGDLTNSGDGAYFIDRVPTQRDRTSEPTVMFTIVTPGTFAALGTPLKKGRDFSESDTEDAPLVAIVNEALVRQAFGDQDPIGRTIFCSFDRKEGMTIVGVVGDIRQRHPALGPMPDCIMPYRQHNYNSNMLNVVIRTAGEPTEAFSGTVRKIAAEIAPQVPVSFTTMEATLSKRVEAAQFRAVLFALSAGLAVCLAMAGVYGVMTHAVGLRSREIGLRMALGASRASVLRLILGQGLVLAAAGLAIGLGAAFAATRLLTTVLFEVRPVDAQVHLGVVLLVGIVTLIAGYLPARRAAVVDPAEVLKTE